MLQFKPIIKYGRIHFVNTHARLFLDIVPECIANRLFRIIDPDVIIRHILKHGMHATMMEIIEFSLSEIKKMDDLRNT